MSIDTPGTYTLLAVDPDAPSPHSPKHRSWLHWMASPGRERREGRAEDSWAAYKGPPAVQAVQRRLR